MTTRMTSILTCADFEHLLDVYGADRTRWPLGCRAGATALLSSDVSARRLLAEAIALDAVLAKGEPDAQADTGAMGALAARIIAAAAITPRVAAVTPAPVPALANSRGRALPGSRQMTSGLWRGAAMLAASLVLGIFVGQSQLGAYALPKIAAAAGLSLGSTERLALADIELDATELD